MISSLALFTASFPHSKHDEFLSQEILYLATKFEQIVIFPSKIQSKESMWKLPENVAVDLSFANALYPTHLCKKNNFNGTLRRIFMLPHSLLTFLSQEQNKPKLPEGQSKFVLEVIADFVKEMTDYVSCVRWAKNRNAFANVYIYWIDYAVLAIRNSWPDAKIIVRGHGSDIYPFAHSHNYLPSLEKALASANKILAVSVHGKNFLSEKFPQYATKIELSRLGISIPESVNRPSVDGKIRIVSNSSIDSNKQVSKILDVMIQIATEIEAEVTWNHFGSGPLWGQLCKLRDSVFLRNLKINLHGQVSHATIYSHYENEPVDLFINLSKSEGLPISVLEALAHGIPVIAPNVGGINEVVKNPINSLISSNAEVSKIVTECVRLVMRPELDRLNRRQEIISIFDEKKVYENWSRYLTEFFE